MAQEGVIPPSIADRVGFAKLPGVPFVGGYHLVIWEHSPHIRLATKFVEYLTGQNAPETLFPSFGFPVRREMLDQDRFRATEASKVIHDSILSGHTFPSGQLWGLVETRIVNILPAIWLTIFEADKPDLEKLLSDIIVPMANRLRMTLKR